MDVIAGEILGYDGAIEIVQRMEVVRPRGAAIRERLALGLIEQHLDVPFGEPVALRLLRDPHGRLLETGGHSCCRAHHASADQDDDGASQSAVIIRVVSDSVQLQPPPPPQPCPHHSTCGLPALSTTHVR
jgi:hypothetical protein